MSSADYPEALESVIALLKTLPGIGRRAAERSTLAMLRWQPEKLGELAGRLAELQEKVGACPECGAWAAAGELCRVCSAPNRDRATICVVEEAAQIFTIEKSGQYRGLYHVLGGRLSPLDGCDADDLAIEPLLRRASDGTVREVILALSADVEGRATAVYLHGLLEPVGVRLSQPALGLPAGSNLAYADAATISAALSGRRTL